MHQPIKYTHSGTEAEPLTPLEAALSYIDRGYAVVPGFSPSMLLTPAQGAKLRDGTDLVSRFLWYFYIRLCKISLKPDFFLHPLTTKEEVTHWFSKYPDANLQIVLGRRSGIVALDMDLSMEGVTHVASKYKTQKSSTGNGIHCYFRYPGDRKWTRYITPDGMYLKGDHCLVHAPPSVHANGRAYFWIDDTTPLAEMPEELLASKKAFLSRLGLFELCKFGHNVLFIYVVYPCFRRLMAALNKESSRPAPVDSAAVIPVPVVKSKSG